MFKDSNKILVGTSNKGKVQEIADLLNVFGCKIFSILDFDINEIPEENGSNFSQNALIKAKFYFAKTNLPTIADDSGLVINGLDGMPGINSSRFANELGGYENAFEKIAAMLDNIDDKSAYFNCSLAIKSAEIEEVFEGRVKGKITFPARGKNGFGYDPIFVPDGFDKTFAELGNVVKDKISHRAQAFTKLLKHFEHA